MTIGSAESCNVRTVSKHIYMGGAKSCQLVMGVTHLHAGSVWNTMPPHTHMRRSEVYLYFNLVPDAVVFHMMGPLGETRHILMNSLQAVVSPGWSIHAGVGTGAYSFCWAWVERIRTMATWTSPPLPRFGSGTRSRSGCQRKCCFVSLNETRQRGYP
jgi:5-keto 4-deoxyuronate isomerase